MTKKINVVTPSLYKDAKVVGKVESIDEANMVIKIRVFKEESTND